MAKKPTHMTNVEFVTEMMEYSRFGALAQAFVVEAIMVYADQIAKQTSEDFPPASIVAPEVWIGIAKEIQEKLKQRNKLG